MESILISETSEEKKLIFLSVLFKIVSLLKSEKDKSIPYQRLSSILDPVKIELDKSTFENLDFLIIDLDRLMFFKSQFEISKQSNSHCLIVDNTNFESFITKWFTLDKSLIKKSLISSFLL